jgi:hypothetical protein
VEHYSHLFEDLVHCRRIVKAEDAVLYAQLSRLSFNFGSISPSDNGPETVLYG